MPYKYKGSRSFSVWIDEDLLFEIANVADKLGYSSLSRFVNELLVEAVTAYHEFRVYNSRTTIRKAIKSKVRASVFAKLFKLMD